MLCLLLGLSPFLLCADNSLVVDQTKRWALLSWYKNELHEADSEFIVKCKIKNKKLFILYESLFQILTIFGILICDSFHNSKSNFIYIYSEALSWHVVLPPSSCQQDRHRDTRCDIQIAVGISMVVEDSCGTFEALMCM